MFIISLDYDGTVMEGSFPELGNPIMEVINKVLSRHTKQVKMRIIVLIIYKLRQMMEECK